MQLRQFLKRIADAIRSREGSTAHIPAADFESRITNLPSIEGLDGLVDGTLTEFVNDRVAVIKPHLFEAEWRNQYLTRVSCEKVNTVGISAFSGCYLLNSVQLPALEFIQGSAFSECEALKALKFPQLWSIRSGAFVGCYALRNFDFGPINNYGVPPSIYGQAFMSCRSLESFVIRHDMVCELDSPTAFDTDTPIAEGTGYIYVPRSLVDAYKTAENWSHFANQIRALEDYTIDGTTTGELDPSKI